MESTSSTEEAGKITVKAALEGQELDETRNENLIFCPKI
jgi:hypothetical protein